MRSAHEVMLKEDQRMRLRRAREAHERNFPQQKVA